MTWVVFARSRHPCNLKFSSHHVQHLSITSNHHPITSSHNGQRRPVPHDKTDLKRSPHARATSSTFASKVDDVDICLTRPARAGGLVISLEFEPFCGWQSRTPPASKMKMAQTPGLCLIHLPGLVASASAGGFTSYA